MRPHICPDETCEPLFSTYKRETFDKGESYLCWGRLKEPNTFLAKEVEHKNEYHRCIYTPLKGHIMFFMNIEDAWVDFEGTERVIIDTLKRGRRVHQENLDSIGLAHHVFRWLIKKLQALHKERLAT